MYSKLDVAFGGLRNSENIGITVKVLDWAVVSTVHQVIRCYWKLDESRSRWLCIEGLRATHYEQLGVCNFVRVIHGSRLVYSRGRAWGL